MSQPSSNTIAVLGGGISGLSIAWYLKKKGFDVTLFEAEKETGGVIRSEQHEHNVFDFGPNTIRDKTGSVYEMVSNLGLTEEVLTISEASKVRYIVRDGELKSITQNPLSFLFSDVLSWKGKKELFSEPLKKALKSDEDESIGSFLERRIGKEAVEYLADPFFFGIYAGDIYSMSKQTLIRKFSDFEQKYGSIFKGILKNRNSKASKKPKVISFKKGVQQLTNALAKEVSDHIKFEKVDQLQFGDSKFQIRTQNNSYEFDRVVSCLPAYALEEILEIEYKNLKKGLSEISYPSMLSTQLVFKKEDLSLPDKGFGFLIPRKENTRLLGAIWKSNIFPEQTKEEFVHINLMTGGAHDQDVSESEIKTTEDEVTAEFLKIMKIDAKPVATDSKLWQKSIPQFRVGYKAIEETFKRFESTHKGFHIAGNYRWGVSVSDCVEGAGELVNDIS
ncbi:MAG: protoporphyrinogen oxidase [Balneola sp.]